MRHIWKIEKPDENLVREIANELNLSELLSHCLVNRGFSSAQAAEEFLSPKLSDLAPPELIPNLSLAVDRLLGRIGSLERVKLAINPHENQGDPTELGRQIHEAIVEIEE